MGAFSPAIITGRSTRCPFRDHSCQGLMMRKSIASKSRRFRVASATPSVIACAAIKVSNCREPTRCSEISTFDPKSPQHFAQSRSNVTTRSRCRSISRSSHGNRSARIRTPRVVRMPMVSSATTIVESSVSLRCAYSHATTLLSGRGLVISLKTFVSTKIIELEGNDSISKAAMRQVNLDPGPGHRDQFVDPIVVGRGRGVTSSRFADFASISIRIHLSKPPVRSNNIIMKAL